MESNVNHVTCFSELVRPPLDSTYTHDPILWGTHGLMILLFCILNVAIK